MPILHMETDMVRSTGMQLQQASVLLREQVTQISYSVQTLASAWQGPGTQIYLSELQTVVNQLNQFAITGESLNNCLKREIREWEQVGANLEKSLYGNDFVSHIEKISPLSTNLVLANPNPATTGLVAAILEDEAERRDFIDYVGDVEAWFIEKYEGKLESTERMMLERLTGQSIEEISLGKAQMNPEVVMDMVESGYLNKPEGWEDDKLDISLQLLLNDEKAPELVSARIDQIVDHWADQGQDISDRPEIVATLYSIGLEGKQGVNSNPQPNDRGQSIADRAFELETTRL